MKTFLLASVVSLAALATASVPEPPAPDREVARLQAHFDTVDAELRRADVSRLTPAQRVARARMIAWLREYRDAASFPRNDRFAGRFVPFFRDSRGVLCAMAYLIERSGYGEFVARIARSRNNAYIRELAADTALLAWLADAGLSVAEAARIQPMYQPPPERDVDQGFKNRSIALGITSVTATAKNLKGSSRVWAWTGLIAGTATLASGIEYSDEGEENKKIAAANILIGVVTVVSTLKGFGTTPSQPRPSGALFTPAVFAASGESHVGFAVAARF